MERGSIRKNDEFMEAYKHLDKICGEIFNNEKGVTTYIYELERQRSGSFYVGSWDVTYQKLKKYRHIRNTYVHEVGTSSSEICSTEDINWLNSFHEDILQRRDPLAQYREILEKKRGENRSKNQKRNECISGNPKGSKITSQNHEFETVGKMVLNISLFILVAISIAAILFLALIIFLFIYF